MKDIRLFAKARKDCYISAFKSSSHPLFAPIIIVVPWVASCVLGPFLWFCVIKPFLYFTYGDHLITFVIWSWNIYDFIINCLFSGLAALMLMYPIKDTYSVAFRIIAWVMVFILLMIEVWARYYGYYGWLHFRLFHVTTVEFAFGVYYNLHLRIIWACMPICTFLAASGVILFWKFRMIKKEYS